MSPATFNRALAASWMALSALGAGACVAEFSATPPEVDPLVPNNLGNLGELPPVKAVPALRAARLSHAQWASTVEDVLGLAPGTAAPWAAAFRSDPNQGGFLFQNDATSFVVDQPLQSAYERGAEAAALAATPGGSLTGLSRWLPATGSDEARARAFIRDFGRRAHRRPLEAGDEEAYLAVFRAGVANPQGQPPFVSGVRLLVQAFLTAPRFLYRLELSTAARDGVVALDAHEVASRLSYFLWGTMPDDVLLAAAEDGSLLDSEVVAIQAARLLESPRALAVVQRFHEALLDMDRYMQISPSRTQFPDAPATLAELAREETRRNVEDTFTSDAGWTHLLTTTESFVNQPLAGLYGVAGVTGGAFRKVTLPEGRRGLFTQVGFLASHSTSTQPDPIHRGVFLTQKVACNALGAPPADLPPLPLPNGRTNREVVASHTESNAQCAACHSGFINPYGFALEGYDAVGRVRTSDNGRPVDTATAVLLGERKVPVSGALQLVDVLAKSPEVHRCYGKHWVEYAFGRKAVADDEGLIGRLGLASADGASMKRLLVGIARSVAFLNRSEVEP